MRRAAPVALAAALTLIATGGCSVDVRRTPTTDSSVALEIRESQRLHLDLREPLDRAEAGLDADSWTVGYDRRAPRFLDTRLLLPEGKVLELQAISATISTAGSTAVAADPERVLVIGLEPDAVAGDRALVAAAADFGFPADRVQAVREALRAGRTGTTGFVETDLGYLGITLEVRLAEADGTVQLSWSLSWEPAASAGATT